MSGDTLNYLGVAALAAAVAYALLARRRPGPPASAPAGPPAPSISRALDDLKHQYADAVIGRKLGDHQAAQLSAAIAGVPAPTPAPAATPAGASA